MIVIEQRIAVGKDLARLRALFFVVEDARIDAFKSPGVKEGRPVNELAQGCKREVV